jgi:hypothetical protein
MTTLRCLICLPLALLVLVPVGCKRETPPPRVEVKPPPTPPAMPAAPDKSEQPGASKGKAPDNNQEVMAQLFNRMQNPGGNRIRHRPSTRLPEDQQKILNEAQAQWEGASSEERLAMIDRLGRVYHADVITLAGKAMEDKNVEVRRAAIQMLVDYDSPNILPVVTKALADSDEDVRLDAINAVFFVDSPEVVDVLAKGLEDSSEDVRMTALDIASEQADDIKYDFYRQGMNSSYQDVRLEVVNSLEMAQNHQAMEVLLEGLKDKDAEVREATKDAVTFLVDQEFNDYESARKWWEKNKNKLDEDLFEIEPEDAPK